MIKYKNIGVVGGAWGFAIAHAISRNIGNITIINNKAEIVDSINRGCVPFYNLPDYIMPKNITATMHPDDWSAYDLIVIAVPAQNVRQLLAELKESNQAINRVVLASKGIEISSAMLMSQVVKEYYNTVKVAALSGPNFAVEVLDDKPAVTTVASQDKEFGSEISANFSTELFHIEVIEDIIGTQLCGALKNVYAIGAGVVSGVYDSNNTFIAYILACIKELSMILEKARCDKETAMTPAGIGDLILTCSDSKSRNKAFGLKLATGNIVVDDIAKNEANLCEGYFTAAAIQDLAKEYECNILASIYELLYCALGPETFAHSLFDI